MYIPMAATTTAGAQGQEGPSSWVEGSWQIEMVDAPKAFRFLGNRSLAWDNNGHAHVAYGSDRLYYAWHDGVSWQLSTVDDGPGVGLFTSLALDASAAPRIAYFDQMEEQLKYASFDGAVWHTEVVAPADWCTWEDGVAALALDAAGRPRILYSGPAGDLRYAQHDGSAWQTERVASSADFPALALDAAGNPHISYFDDLDSDLRYAYRSCHPVRTVHIAGPTSLPVGVAGTYEATYEPPTATVSLITWDNGMIGPDATYDWAVTGTHTVVATATTACGEAQGHLDVAVFCQEVTGLTVSGPPVLAVNQLGTCQAAVQPVTASQPLTLRWDNGTEGDSASYSWATTGTYTLAVTATNVCGPGPETSWEVRVIAAWPHHVYLPMLVRQTQ